MLYANSHSGGQVSSIESAYALTCGTDVLRFDGLFGGQLATLNPTPLTPKPGALQTYSRKKASLGFTTRTEVGVFLRKHVSCLFIVNPKGFGKIGSTERIFITVLAQGVSQ